MICTFLEFYVYYLSRNDVLIYWGKEVLTLKHNKKKSLIHGSSDVKDRRR